MLGHADLAVHGDGFGDQPEGLVAVSGSVPVDETCERTSGGPPLLDDDWNWYLPCWLRWLPDVRVEAAEPLSDGGSGSYFGRLAATGGVLGPCLRRSAGRARRGTDESLESAAERGLGLVTEAARQLASGAPSSFSHVIAVCIRHRVT